MGCGYQIRSTIASTSWKRWKSLKKGTWWFQREREREYIFNRRSTIVQDLQQGLLGAFGAFLLIAVHMLQDACSMHSRCQAQHELYMSRYAVEVSMHRQDIEKYPSILRCIIGLRPLVKLLSTVNFHNTPLIDSSCKHVAFAGAKSNTPLRAAWLNQNKPCNITGFQHLKNHMGVMKQLHYWFHRVMDPWFCPCPSTFRSIAVCEPIQYITQGVLMKFPRALSQLPKWPFPAQPLATKPFPHTKR